MKRVFLAALVLSLVSVGVFAQTVWQHTFSSPVELPKVAGTWEVIAGRLYQLDTQERLSKVNLMVPQSGEMQYSFNVRYEGGGIEDLMGGFGVHVFVDDAWNGKSWGNGDSYLLWLNYDPNATYGSQGFVAQIYRSTSATKMELVGEFDLNRFASYLSVDNADVVVPVRIKVDGRTGSVWVEDPTLAGYGYRFNLGSSLGEGDYVAFRTNSLSLSFDNIEVSRLR